MPVELLSKGEGFNMKQGETVTSNTIGIDFSEFSLQSGWNSVENFTRRVGGLAAFVLVSVSLFPLWSPGQSRFEYQLADHTHQLEVLSQVPQKLALIEQRQSQMEARQIEDSKAISDIKTAAFSGSIGVLIWLATQLMSYFGAKRKQ